MGIRDIKLSDVVVYPKDNKTNCIVSVAVAVDVGQDKETACIDALVQVMDWFKQDEMENGAYFRIAGWFSQRYGGSLLEETIEKPHGI